MELFVRALEQEVGQAAPERHPLPGHRRHLALRPAHPRADRRGRGADRRQRAADADHRRQLRRALGHRAGGAALLRAPPRGAGRRRRLPDPKRSSPSSRWRMRRSPTSSSAPAASSAISNFLLWQLAYTELYFTDTLWPDFDAAALDAAHRAGTGSASAASAAPASRSRLPAAPSAVPGAGSAGVAEPPPAHRRCCSPGSSPRWCSLPLVLAALFCCRRAGWALVALGVVAAGGVGVGSACARYARRRARLFVAGDRRCWGSRCCSRRRRVRRPAGRRGSRVAAARRRDAVLATASLPLWLRGALAACRAAPPAWLLGWLAAARRRGSRWSSCRRARPGSCWPRWPGVDRRHGGVFRRSRASAAASSRRDQPRQDLGGRLRRAGRRRRSTPPGAVAARATRGAVAARRRPLTRRLLDRGRARCWRRCRSAATCSNRC